MENNCERAENLEATKERIQWEVRHDAIQHEVDQLTQATKVFFVKSVSFGNQSVTLTYAVYPIVVATKKKAAFLATHALFAIPVEQKEQATTVHAQHVNDKINISINHIHSHCNLKFPQHHRKDIPFGGLISGKDAICLIHQEDAKLGVAH